MRCIGIFNFCFIFAVILLDLSTCSPIYGSENSSAAGLHDNGSTNHETTRPTVSNQRDSVTDHDSKAQEMTPLCQISTQESLLDFINLAEKEEKITLFEFTIRMRNYTYNPFLNTTGLYFKPWLWYTTRSRHGRTLLMLSFHYDVLSMNILTIGVKQVEVELVDSPHGCFGLTPTEQQVNLVRTLLLSRSVVGQSSSYGKSSREEFACNQVIKDWDGEAEFLYNCCFKDGNGVLRCSTEGDDFWISILYFAITSVKVLMFLFCPNFIPINAYSVTYMASEYMVSLKQKLKMKLFISEKTDTTVKYKKRLTLEDVSEWWRFREVLDTLPCDEIVPVEVTELRIKVKGKRIIPESDPPTGLIRTIYDNLVRCKMKNLDPFHDCCESSIYAEMEPKFRYKMTWHRFVQLLMKGFMLLLVPVPFYVRLLIYYRFEEKELKWRREAMKRNGLGESFNFYRANVIQYFTPTHGIFIATYILYVVVAVIIGLTSEAFRNKLKDVARSALSDMNSVSQTGVLGIIIRTMLYPCKRCGILGLLIAPVYLVLVLPLCGIVFALYCVPTIYLSLRLPYYARKLLGTSATMAAAEKKKKLLKMRKVGRKISKIDKSAHCGNVMNKGDKFLPDDTSFHGCETIKNVTIQVACAAFCLCILYSVALLFAESIGLFVEVISFTMMGIIVNAGSVLKYVSMVLLVFVYMNDCYSNVYENYLTFNKTIIDDIIERTTADLRKIASMPSSQQTNTAFHVKCVDEEKELVPSLNFKKKEPRWKMGQLLLFLDCFDTPRIPLRLFQKLCQVRVYGAPGPVYLNLLAATGKFMIIVVFLMFVMIVVMAFGNVYEMSNTNTTLATLAGGFVPMLLKNVLSSKGARLSLKTVSFKGQIDEIIGEYKQYWPLTDFIMHKYSPEDEEENKEGETTEASDGKNETEKLGKSVDGKAKSLIRSKSEDTDKDHEKNKEKHKSGDSGKSNKAGESNNNGMIPSAPGISSYKSIDDDDAVDLFIDLSVADTAGWSIYGSSESIPSETIMPGYFDPNKIVDDDEDESQPSFYQRDDKPIEYFVEAPVTHHKQPPV